MAIEPDDDQTLPPDLQQDLDLDATIAQGTSSTLFGDHELLSEVARGGMGIVYKARQRSLDRTVALKVILTGQDASKNEISRFEIEAKAAARLDHPYIVPVYSFGMMQNQPYFTMGFVEGVSLANRLEQHGALHPSEAAELMMSAAFAIDYAHNQNVVHRDLKPANVLIDEEGHPRITDFGLAKRQDAGQSMTATGQILGTPAYMAPEQAAGEEVGPSADIYSLGATLYAAITGLPPFDASSLPELLLKIVDESPIPPHQRNSDVPKQLSNIAMRCLEKSPENRYRTAKELADDLERYLNGQATFHRSAAARKRTRNFWIISLTAFTAILSFGLYAFRSTLFPNANPNANLATKNPDNPLKSKESLTEQDLQLTGGLQSAIDKLLPNANSTLWELNFDAAAKVIQAEFAKADLPILDLEPEVLASKMKGKPASFLDAIIQGLELWELFSTASDSQDASNLRSLQSAIDETTWRQQLRLLRDDKNEVQLLASLKNFNLNSITTNQAELLGFMATVYRKTQPIQSMEVIQKFKGRYPTSFWLNLLHSEIISELAVSLPAETRLTMADAIGPTREAMALRPEVTSLHKKMANLLLALGNRDAAEQETVVLDSKIYPDGMKQFDESIAFWKAGNHSRAIESMDRLASEYPEWIRPRAWVCSLKLLEQPHLEDIEDLLILKKLMGDSMKNAADILNTVYHTFHSADISENLQRDPLAKFWDRELHNSYLCSFLFLASQDLDPNLLIAYTYTIYDPKQRFEMSKLVYDNHYERSSKKWLIAYHHALNMVYSGIAIDTALPIIEYADEKSDPIYHARCNGIKGRILEKLGRMDEAFEAHLKACQLSPNNPYADCDFLDFAIRQNKSKQLGMIAESDPILKNKTSYQVIEAVSKFQQGDLEGLRKQDQKIQLQGQPTDWLCKSLLSRFGCLSASETRAYNDFLHSPSGVYQCFAFIAVFLRGGNIELANLALEEVKPLVVQSLPNDPLIEMGSRERAIPIAYESFLGKLAILDGKPAEAAKHFEIAYGLDPLEDVRRGTIGTWEGYGADYAQALIESGDLEKGERIALENLQMHPFQGRAHYAMALLYAHQGKQSEAQKAFQKAMDLDPLDPWICFENGRFQLLVANDNNGLKSLQRAIDLASNDIVREYKNITFESIDTLLEYSISSKTKPSIAAACRTRALKWMQSELRTLALEIEGPQWLRRLAARSKTIRSKSIRARILAKLENLATELPQNEKSEWGRIKKMADQLESSAQSITLPAPNKLSDTLRNYQYNRHREAAEWVLAQGGYLIYSEILNEPWISKEARVLSDLPSTPFQVNGVSLDQCDINDSDLLRFEDLLVLRQISLSGTAVTDRAVQRMAKNIPSLWEIGLEQTAVTDRVLQDIKNVPSIYLRNSKVTDQGIQSLSRPDAFEILHSEQPSTPESSLAPNSAISYTLMLDQGSRILVPEVALPESAFTFEAVIQASPQLQSSESEIFYFWDNLKNPADAQGNSVLRLGTYAPRQLIFSMPLPNGANDHSKTDINSWWVRHDRPIHVAMSFDGNTLRGFCDGNQVVEKALPGTKIASSLRGRIGGNENPRMWQFYGTMDEIRISSVARYNESFTPVRRHERDSQTLVLYHFDEGSGDIAHDDSGNGRDGEILQPNWIREEP